MVLFKIKQHDENEKLLRSNYVIAHNIQEAIGNVMDAKQTGGSIQWREYQFHELVRLVYDGGRGTIDETLPVRDWLARFLCSGLQIFEAEDG